MTNAVVIELRDLRYLEVLCSACRCGLALDLETAHALTEGCPMCQRKFDPETGEAVGLLKRVYQTRHQIAGIRFRVPVGGGQAA